MRSGFKMVMSMLILVGLSKNCFTFRLPSASRRKNDGSLDLSESLLLLLYNKLTAVLLFDFSSTNSQGMSNTPLS